MAKEEIVTEERVESHFEADSINGKIHAQTLQCPTSFLVERKLKVTKTIVNGKVVSEKIKSISEKRTEIKK